MLGPAQIRCFAVRAGGFAFTVGVRHDGGGASRAPRSARSHRQFSALLIPGVRAGVQE